MTFRVHADPSGKDQYLFFSRKRQIAVLAQVRAHEETKQHRLNKSGNYFARKQRRKGKDKKKPILNSLTIQELYRKAHQYCDDIVHLNKDIYVIGTNKIVLVHLKEGISQTMMELNRDNPLVKIHTNGKQVIVELLHEIRIYQYDTQHDGVTFIGSHKDKRDNDTIMEEDAIFEMHRQKKQLKKEGDPAKIKAFVDLKMQPLVFYSNCAVTKDYLAYITSNHKLATVDFQHSRKQTTDIGEGHTNLTIDSTGNYLATASENGRKINIFRRNGQRIAELRRGTSDVVMYDLCFNDDASMLACYSSSGTIHVFNTGITEEKQRRNAYSMLYYFSYLGIDYFKSEWSMARYTTPHRQVGQLFFKSNTMEVHLITNDGHHVVVDFAKKSPDCFLSYTLDDYISRELSLNHTHHAEKCYFLLKSPVIPKHRDFFWSYSLIASATDKPLQNLMESMPHLSGLTLFVNDIQLTEKHFSMTFKSFFEQYPPLKHVPYQELTIIGDSKSF